jgi:hypothetical protein
MTPEKVLGWLLEEEQPAVRYLTLTRLMERSEKDREVRAARAEIPRRGWVADILASRQFGGWWVEPRSLYRPKYLSTNWMMLILSDLGLTRAHPEIRESAELWMRRFASRDGAFGLDGGGRGELCIVGNTARALIRFGYEDHPEVRGALEWLVEQANPKGGWACWGSGRNLDSWEGLSAFAAYPRGKWSSEMTEVVELGAEFFLQRELFRQGDRYAPWYRFHYPVHYYYDLLVGLEMLTSLGYSGDPRLRRALSHLRRKRRKDGRWNLDALHPDVEGGVAGWIRAHPDRAPVPFGLERVGLPSKMITLRALIVLARVKAAAAV